MLSHPAAFPVQSAAILAAGKGTRLRPLSDACPKELLPLGSKPVLGWVMEELAGAGIQRALIVTSKHKPQIREYLGGKFETAYGAIQCEYATQPEQRGSGEAIHWAREWAGDEPFLTAFADCVICGGRPGDACRRLLETHAVHRAAATCLVESVPPEETRKYGIVAPGAPARAGDPFPLADIVEKPPRGEAPSNLAVAARWVFTPAIFAAVERAGADRSGEVNIPNAVRVLLQDGASAWAAPLESGERRCDAGTLEEYLAEFVAFALMDAAHGERARVAAAAFLRA